MFSMYNTYYKALVVYASFVAIVICTVLLVFSDDVQADDYASLGVGIFSNAKHSLAEAKFGNIGAREYLAFGFFNQYEVGGWVQTDVGDGRKSSGYIADQVGVEASDVVTMRFAFGPAVISTPDSYLGGSFPQFTEDLFLGIRGTNGNTLGFKYKHFSSAGFSMPNNGRDFGGLEIALPF